AGPRRWLHFHFIWYNIVFGPAVDRTNSDDNGIERIVLATRDRLPLVDHFRSQHDGIFGSVDVRAVTANALNSDINRIDVGAGVTLGDADVTNLQIGLVVKSESVIWFRPARVKSVPQHGACTDAKLLCRLANEDDGAVPLIFHFRERTRHPDDHRNVSVVPAGVHDMDIVTLFIFGYNRAGVWQSRFFLHRQRVEVGAHQDHWTIAILHQVDDAKTFVVWFILFADVLSHVAPDGF